MHIKQQQVYQIQQSESSYIMAMVQINIKKTMEKNLSEMATNVQFKTIEALAEIYGFKVDDAVKQIGLEIDKTAKKTSNKPKTNAPSVLLPWCGEVNQEWCCGLRNNAGLQSQCTMAKMEGGKFCKTCQKQSEKEGNNGKPNYGEVSDRVAAGDDYEGVKGKKPVKYSVVMEKKGISREEAVREAEKLGWTIPETEFEVVSKKIPKKKKNTSVSDTESDTDSDSDADKPKKRGRPSKKKVVKNDDALSKMVDKVNASDSSSESESDAEKPKKKQKKVKKVPKKETLSSSESGSDAEKPKKKEKKPKKEKKEKKELSDEEKAAKKEETNRKRKETREKNKAKKAEEDKAKKAEEDKALENQINKEIEELELSDAESIEEPQEETKNEPEEETKNEPEKETKNEPEEDIVECASSDTINKTIDGKIYLMEKGDEEKCLYDKVTGECVGTYDEEKDAINPVEDLDSDSDDE